MYRTRGLKSERLKRQKRKTRDCQQKSVVGKIRKKVENERREAEVLYDILKTKSQRSEGKHFF
jgi:hypothetical protein